MRGMGRRIILATAISFSAICATAQTPVEDHWSPYDYPKEIPAGAKYHIIVKGDTLWDIAGAYFGNPLLWPQLYQKNEYIRDPDLIYPGDPIFLDIGVVVNDQTIAQSLDGEGTATDETPETDGEDAVFAEFEEMDDQDQGEADEGEAADDTEITERSESASFDDFSSEFVILPAGDRADMECSSYILPMSGPRASLPFDLIVSGGEETELSIFSEGQVVYLNKGADDGVSSGDVFSVRRPMENVYVQTGKNRRKFIGMAIDQVGQIKIVATQQRNATALIIYSCQDIRMGDFCVPYEQEPIPLITELPVVDRFQAFEKPLAGSIVYSEDGLLSFGKGHIVNIDMGLSQNIAPGDLFIIYRENPNSNPRNNVFLPDIYLGHGVALKTADNSTVLRIIEAFTELHVGDLTTPLSSAFSE